MASPSGSLGFRQEDPHLPVDHAEDHRDGHLLGHLHQADDVVALAVDRPPEAGVPENPAFEAVPVLHDEDTEPVVLVDLDGDLLLVREGPEIVGDHHSGVFVFGSPAPHEVVEETDQGEAGQEDRQADHDAFFCGQSCGNALVHFALHGMVDY